DLKMIECYPRDVREARVTRDIVSHLIRAGNRPQRASRSVGGSVICPLREIALPRSEIVNDLNERPTTFQRLARSDFPRLRRNEEIRSSATANTIRKRSADAARNGCRMSAAAIRRIDHNVGVSDE